MFILIYSGGGEHEVHEKFEEGGTSYKSLGTSGLGELV
jgi:hypothetical protein